MASPRRGQGERELEGGASAFSAYVVREGEGPAVPLDDAPGEGEPEPRPLGPAGGEGLEEALAQAWRDPGTVVPDPEPRRAPVTLTVDVDGERPGLGRVGEEVRQHLAHAIAVGIHREGRDVERDGDPRMGAGEGAGRLGGQHGQVEGELSSGRSRA